MEVNSLYTSFSVAPVVPTAAPSALANAVDTILPPGSQSVAPVGATSSSGATDQQQTSNGQSQGAPADPAGQTPVVAKFTRDAATNALVFMEIDAQTQAVIVQFPDEQLLKLRSYVAEMQRRDAAAQKSIPGANLTKTM